MFCLHENLVVACYEPWVNQPCLIRNQKPMLDWTNPAADIKAGVAAWLK